MFQIAKTTNHKEAYVHALMISVVFSKDVDLDSLNVVIIS